MRVMLTLLLSVMRGTGSTSRCHQGRAVGVPKLPSLALPCQASRAASDSSRRDWKWTRPSPMRNA